MKRAFLVILFSMFITNANADILTVAGSTVGAYIGASEGNKSNTQYQKPIVLKSDKKNVHVVTCRVYDGFCEITQRHENPTRLTPAQFAKSMGYDYIHSVTTLIVPREDNSPADYYVIEVSN